MASEYLTPYQELMEATRGGDRTIQASIEQNPLYQRDQAILSKATPVTAAPVIEEVAAVTPAAVVPNPLVRPPVPLSTMPIDKQMAWQKRQQEDLIRQDAHNKALLEQASGQRREEFDREGVRQATALLGETGRLKPDDLVNYPLQRGELARKYPIGAMSTEAKNILSHYDTVYANTLQINKETERRQNELSIGRESQRREDAFKVASDLGADAIARFYEREKINGSEAAIEGVMKEAGMAKQENITAQLLNAGMTLEDIQKKFTGPSGEFLYPAAEAQAKVRVNPQQEVKRVADSLTDLMQEKREAGRKWTPMQEDALQRTYELYNQTMERAGIKGPTGNATTTATPTPTPIRAGVQRPSATPSPTPPPPPLNPQYEEGWKNGQRYIKMEDGQWHLSKVQ